MSTDHVKFLSTKIETETKKFDLVSKCFSNILKAEEELKKRRLEAYDVLGKIDDDNDYINNMYVNFKESLKDLEFTRERKIQKLKTSILPAIKYYPYKVKEFKRPLDQIKDYDKNIQKYTSKIETAKNKGSIDIQTIKANEDERNKIGNEKEKTKNLLENNLLLFEAERLDDNKAFLLQFIHMEIAYHASALQSLSKLYSEINILEPKEKLKEFIAKYNLSSMRDYNVEDKFKFKMGETERRVNELKSKSQNLKNDGNNVGKADINKVDGNVVSAVGNLKSGSVRNKIIDDI
jgi:hypothetical protein